MKNNDLKIAKNILHMFTGISLIGTFICLFSVNAGSVLIMAIFTIFFFFMARLFKLN